MDVLVVDDEAIARRMVENALTEGGYNVFTAANGREALEMLQQRRIQLVVSDWEMPIMSGLEFCKAVRAGDSSQYVYIIMVTSRNNPVETISGFAVGADDYVAKPFNPAELVWRVNAGKRVVGMKSSAMTIFALAKLAESRDQETGAHLERVRSFCRILGLQLQQTGRFRDEIDDNFVRLLYETSPLHDIGKVAIPDNVLLKPGRLTEDEFDIMKSHTTRGAETIQSLLTEFPDTEFLQVAHDIILSHHEKYDGSGYPNGIVGQDIPLCGRTLAVADAYDALTSKRVYKDAFSHMEARTIIVNGSGKHFDPAIVDAFVEVEDEFTDIRQRYSDSEANAATFEEVAAHCPRVMSNPEDR
ncbi:HD domain-containing phosphohydrolase [Planctomycetota bacterium]